MNATFTHDPSACVSFCLVAVSVAAKFDVAGRVSCLKPLERLSIVQLSVDGERHFSDGFGRVHSPLACLWRQ